LEFADPMKRRAPRVPRVLRSASMPGREGKERGKGEKEKQGRERRGQGGSEHGSKSPAGGSGHVLLLSAQVLHALHARPT